MDTPAYLGKDPELLLKLSELSGLQIVTKTGYYGARNDKIQITTGKSSAIRDGM